MACNHDTSATLSRKRKRTRVSYAEVDQLADVLSEEEDDVSKQSPESSNDESDNDDRTYSRRKKSPKKTKKKKASLTARPRPQDKGTFRLLDLPPELRDAIYEMALTDVDGISIVAKNKAYRRAVTRGLICPDGDRQSHPRFCNCSNSKKAAPKQTSLVPNILLANKQIHNEAINVLYGQKFIFEDTSALHRFLATIGTRNQQRLQSIDVRSFCMSRYSSTVNHCAFALLAAATNLKVLRLSKESGWRLNAKGLARNLYRDVHFFLEAYGAANGRRDAGIDIIKVDEKLFDYVDDWRPRPGHAGEQTVEAIEAVYLAELRRLVGV